MIPFVGETLLGGGSEIVGSYLDGEARRRAGQRENRIRAEDVALQREFAQNSVRWRVEDAKQAGIAPLAALGMQGSSYQPVGLPQVEPDTQAGDMARSLGQNISRAISATRTAEEREQAQLNLAYQRTQLQGAEIDNAIRLHQLQSLRGGNPPMAGSEHVIPGQSGSGVKTRSMERTASMKGAPHAEAGAVNDVGYTLSSSGALIPVPSKDTKERIEDNIFQEAAHFLRNNIMPNITSRGAPPKSALPPGARYWEWSYRDQGWKPRYDKYKWDYRTDGK